MGEAAEERSGSSEEESSDYDYDYDDEPARSDLIHSSIASLGDGSVLHTFRPGPGFEEELRREHDRFMKRNFRYSRIERLEDGGFLHVFARSNPDEERTPSPQVDPTEDQQRMNEANETEEEPTTAPNDSDAVQEAAEHDNDPPRNQKRGRLEEVVSDSLIAEGTDPSKHAIVHDNEPPLKRGTHGNKKKGGGDQVERTCTAPISSGEPDLEHTFIPHSGSTEQQQRKLEAIAAEQGPAGASSRIDGTLEIVGGENLGSEEHPEKQEEDASNGEGKQPTPGTHV